MCIHDVVEAHATAAEFVFEVYLAVCVAMAKLVFMVKTFYS